MKKKKFEEKKLEEKKERGERSAHGVSKRGLTTSHLFTMGNAFYKTSPTVSEASWALVAQERKEAYEKLEKVRAELSAARAAAHCKELEGVLFRLDVANGQVRTRSQLEAFLSSILDARKPAPASMPTTPSAKQKLLLDGTFLPALVSYICVTAEENAAVPKAVLQQARGLYGILSKALHASSEGGIPTEIFCGPHLDRDAIIAFAAIARFAKRDPSLYSRGGARYELRMRIPPSAQNASVEDVRAEPELPPVTVSTGVLRGAEEGGSGKDSEGGEGSNGDGESGSFLELSSPREPLAQE